MRQSIPNFARMVAPLADMLTEAASTSASRKKSLLATVPLCEQWTPEQLNAFNDIKAMLLRLGPFIDPDPTQTLCVYPDASQDFWGLL